MSTKLSSLSIGFESAGAIVELAVRGDLTNAPGETDVVAIQARVVAQGIHARSDLSCQGSSLLEFATALAAIQLGQHAEARLNAVGTRVSTLVVQGQGAGQCAKLSVLGCLADHRVSFVVQDWLLVRHELQDLQTWFDTILGLGPGGGRAVGAPRLELD